MIRIFSNWDFMRILRLLMGIWIVYSSFADKQPILALIGLVFIYQAIKNVGCCGGVACSIDLKPKNEKNEGIK
jgi:uncharacterized membrane protein HdeD (DUF308 family)